VESTDQHRSLIRAAQGGNHSAFEQLVCAYDQAVLRLAFRITGSESDAQDVYQEAFLKVYRKLDGFRFECAFSTWVYRIATNVCLDLLRRRRARAESGPIESNVDTFLSHVSDDKPVNNPEQQLLRQELGANIARALRRLTPRERIVFELKHFHGLKLQQVSEILDCSEPAAKTSLFRATKKLRLYLARYTKRTAKQSGPQELNPYRKAVITLRERQNTKLRCAVEMPGDLIDRSFPAEEVTIYQTKVHRANELHQHRLEVIQTSSQPISIRLTPPPNSNERLTRLKGEGL
jgi:RNA polymerase sigma-70 factor, ECF subfamily